jgi:EpsI family protein
LPQLFRSMPVRIATLFVIFQGALLYSSLRPEAVPPSRPLAEFPLALGPWQFAQEGVVDQETRDVLKADDLLDRVYVNSSGQAASLFVAAFRSTRNGKTPHSPKNCLPGSGWTPLVSDYLPVSVGAAEPITVNRYVVTNGDSRALVLYWYQSRNRVVANEFKAKFWMMADAIRLNRSDTALVRVVVNMTDSNPAPATASAVKFVQSMFPALRQFLPS